MEAKTTDSSTEEKIKEAAKVVFYRKGFAATRTRDIADEAGINLALLNYYFRSKAKLFEMIMLETLTGFFKGMIGVLNDEATVFEDKIEIIVSRYIDMMISEPEVPTFIITEIRSNPAMLLEKIPIKRVLENSVFFKQHQKVAREGLIVEPNILHFMMNLMGMIIFPFIARPMITAGEAIDAKNFEALMQQRKKLIPIWISAMMQSKL